ncbi:MAG: sigma-54-dependent Fis family transcriptional regulator [Bryobacteraceae bacterium]|nr:sigma-54-dependent Fis family transcriptional regulator [Bryobacteraceae bacterium]
MSRILIAEDEKPALLFLSRLLTKEGYEVIEAENGDEAWRICQESEPDLVLLDIRLPGLNGLEILNGLKRDRRDTAVIVMTADSNYATAVEAMRLGAFEFVSKPLDFDHLLILVQRALEYRAMEREVRAFRAAAQQSETPPGRLIGHTQAMREVYKRIGRAAASDTTVLVRGESGTGKELVVDALHAHSLRANGPLVKVNCASIPEALLESELFGHEKGSFTSASYQRIGRFEEANGGTLFLDEVAELPLVLQAKLLRAVQERVIYRLGSNRPIPVDLRLVAATAQDLEAMVQSGQFREDLYYRLNVFRIDVPPLRERLDDLPLLVQHFISRSQRPVTLNSAALAKLCSYSWPGNVRELENVISRALALTPGGVITPEAIELSPLPSQSSLTILGVPLERGLREIVGQAEKQALQAALAHVRGNKRKAAELLRIHRSLLYEKLKEHNVA